MNFTQIRSFIAAAECENFTHAAKRLFITQPVLSRHISAMEDELGAMLFKREKRTIRLTEAGKIMFSGLSRLMREYDVVVAQALAAQNDGDRRIVIGFVEGQLFARPFATPVSAFRASHPEIQVDLQRYSIRGLKEALLHGEIDVALVAKFKHIDDNPELDYIEVGTTPKVLAVSVDHRLASKQGVSVEDMRGESIVILSNKESLVMTTEIEEALGGIEYKQVVVPDIGAYALAIEAGYGIAMINSNHSLQCNPRMRFIPIEGFTDFIETVTWRRDNANPAIALFVKEFLAKDRYGRSKHA